MFASTMKQIKVNKDKFKQVRLVNKKTDRYFVYLSPVAVEPKETAGTDEVPDYEKDLNTLFIQTECFGYPSTYKLRELLADVQKEYDSSNVVNRFLFEGKEYWFDKTLRLSIANSFNILKNNNKTIGTIWLGTIECHIDIEYMLEFLNKLELYAIECNNVTNSHLKAISKLDTPQDILNYNVTAGYPEPLVMDREKCLTL